MNHSGFQGVQGIVGSMSDVFSGEVVAAALADDNLAGLGRLAFIDFDPKAF